MIIAESRSSTGGERWVLRCDICHVKAGKTASEPGDAAEEARKLGFTPKMRGATDPAIWSCPACAAKETKNA